MSDAIAVDQLRSIVQRIETASAERDERAEDVKAIFAEAKSNGWDTAALRAVVKRRKADKAALAEFETILELYEGALA